MIRRSHFVFVSLFLPLVGCSSTESGAGSTTTGTDAGTRTDASSTTGGDSATGSSTPAACEAQILYKQRCNVGTEAKSDACAAGRRLTCDKTLATMSPAFAQAVVDCETSAVVCDEGPDTCIATKLAAAPAPTAAMTKVRDDFCKTCASASCAADFFKIDQNEGNGPGYLILQVSDAVAGTIDSKCTGANTPPLDPDAGIVDCSQAFAACASDTQQSSLPDDPETCFAPDPGTDAAAD